MLTACGIMHLRSCQLAGTVCVTVYQRYTVTQTVGWLYYCISDTRLHKQLAVYTIVSAIHSHTNIKFISTFNSVYNYQGYKFTDSAVQLAQ